MLVPPTHVLSSIHFSLLFSETEKHFLLFCSSQHVGRYVLAVGQTCLLILHHFLADRLVAFLRKAAGEFILQSSRCGVGVFSVAVVWMTAHGAAHANRWICTHRVWPSLGDRRFRNSVCACVCCCSADNVVREYTLQKETYHDDAQTLYIGRFGTLPSFSSAIQNSMVGHQRLQISELQFDKFPTPSSILFWKIRLN